jgi:hypothetical protein
MQLPRSGFVQRLFIGNERDVFVVWERSHIG